MGHLMKISLGVEFDFPAWGDYAFLEYSNPVFAKLRQISLLEQIIVGDFLEI